MEEDPRTYTPARAGKSFVVGWILLIVVVVGLTAGLMIAHAQHLESQTVALRDDMGRGPRVLVEKVQFASRMRDLELPGTIHGYVESPVYAKVAGYLKAILVDKGDRVRKGQLLAVIDSPELDHQVANARAAYNLAVITDRRNQALLKSGVIAKQAADESAAAVAEDKATLDQLITTQRYQRIYAPFDGVVTARLVDPGSLIPESTTLTSNSPILTLATLNPVRVYADVPQTAAPYVRDGDAVTITVAQYPGRVFEGNVTRHPRALDSSTRTMLAEVDLPNDDLALLPGMYATIDFRVTAPAGPPLVPDDALIFRDGKPYVPLVRNDRLKLVEVALGYDDGINVEIPRGIGADDMVAINAGQAARDGEMVQPMTADQAR
ncbi:MAG TPA: efflux RND transporter periplasmic adaptor subunit [Candidatus Binataceae bacterium]|nr:efflux RND transporter periplasmic adaptor subunit [Candidatus Binataceae bacterium]